MSQMCLRYKRLTPYVAYTHCRKEGPYFFQTVNSPYWKLTLFVLFHIQVSKSLAGKDTRAAENSRKFHKTARVMMLFVAAYIAQWWPYVTHTTWRLFGEPHISITMLVTLFANMGGVFNFLAYTLLRNK